jgi:hypothetical protein
MVAAARSVARVVAARVAAARAARARTAAAARVAAETVTARAAASGMAHNCVLGMHIVEIMSGWRHVHGQEGSSSVAHMQR